MRVKRRRLKGFLKEPYPEECLKLDSSNLCITQYPTFYDFKLTKCLKYGKFKRYKPKRGGIVYPFAGYSPDTHGKEHISEITGEKYHTPECRLYSDGEYHPDKDSLYVNWYRIEGAPSRWRRKGTGSKVYKLFEEIAPRYSSRPGGYTRIIKLGPRRSDSAEMVFLELV